MTGSIGTVTLNRQVYNQLSIRPEIPIGKLGVGLDIYLYFNDEGMYWDSWDFSSGGSAYKTIIESHNEYPLFHVYLRLARCYELNNNQNGALLTLREMNARFINHPKIELVESRKKKLDK